MFFFTHSEKLWSSPDSTKHHSEWMREIGIQNIVSTLPLCVYAQQSYFWFPLSLFGAGVLRSSQTRCAIFGKIWNLADGL